MNLEGTRHNEAEYSWTCWKVPKGLSRQAAIEFFLSKVKPSTYKFETIKYDPHTGTVMTC